MLEDARARLTEWAIWQRSGHGGLALGYAAVTFEAATGGGVAVADDSALQVDSVLCDLRRMDPGMFKVVYNRYVRRWDLAVVARELGVGRNKVREVLFGAECWVAAKLHYKAT